MNAGALAHTHRRLLPPSAVLHDCRCYYLPTLATDEEPLYLVYVHTPFLLLFASRQTSAAVAAAERTPTVGGRTRTTAAGPASTPAARGWSWTAPCRQHRRPGTAGLRDPRAPAAGGSRAAAATDAPAASLGEGPRLPCPRVAGGRTERAGAAAARGMARMVGKGGISHPFGGGGMGGWGEGGRYVYISRLCRMGSFRGSWVARGGWIDRSVVSWLSVLL